MQESAHYVQYATCSINVCGYIQLLYIQIQKHPSSLVTR